MYEIVVKNIRTGNVWYTDGGYFYRENAEREAMVIEENEDDYYCEIREEHA